MPALVVSYTLLYTEKKGRAENVLSHVEVGGGEWAEQVLG